MERHRRHLEAQAHQQQAEAGQQHPVLEQHRRGQVGGDAAQCGRAGGAVHEGDAVEQERRGERPQHEVLEGRLLGLDAAQVQGRQHVDRDRQHLEAEEQHDQVVGRRHDDAAGGRQQQQHVRLDARQVLPLQVRAGQQGRGDHGDGEQAGHEQHRSVDGDGTRQVRARPLVLHPVPQRHQRDQHGEARDHRPGGRQPRRQAAHQRGDGQQQQARQRQDQQRDERPPEDHHDGGVAGVGEHQWPSPESCASPDSTPRSAPRRLVGSWKPSTWCSMCSTRASTAGSMRSITGFG